MNSILMLVGINKNQILKSRANKVSPTIRWYTTSQKSSEILDVYIKLCKYKTVLLNVRDLRCSEEVKKNLENTLINIGEVKSKLVLFSKVPLHFNGKWFFKNEFDRMLYNFWIIVKAPAGSELNILAIEDAQAFLDDAAILIANAKNLTAENGKTRKHPRNFLECK